MTPVTHENPKLPSEKEKLNQKGRAILRIARELREFIDFSVNDPDVKTVQRDVETLEEIGRWLSGVTPIDCSTIRESST